MANRDQTLERRASSLDIHLAGVPEIAVTIQKCAQCPATPTNLRMFEDGAHPTYTTGQDITVNWTPTSELRFGFNLAQNLECRAEATILQVLTTAGVLKGEIASAGNAGPMTIPNAQLVALLGSETDFKFSPKDQVVCFGHTQLAASARKLGSKMKLISNPDRHRLLSLIGP